MAICVLLGGLGISPGAEAARPDSQASTAKVSRVHLVSAARAQTARSQASGGISCVPYARQATGMHISGNGWQWWGNAAGSYARGHRPEPGSVLAFRSSGHMRSGHVAVVRQVLSEREVLIDHANWAGPGIRRGTVMQGVRVIDASANNDWSDVRVQIGRDSGSFGRSYPAYGFIYNRADTGRWLAQGSNPGESRPALEEVAEAPEPSNAPRAGERQARRRPANRH